MLINVAWQLLLKTSDKSKIVRIVKLKQYLWIPKFWVFNFSNCYLVDSLQLIRYFFIFNSLIRILKFQFCLFVYVLGEWILLWNVNVLIPNNNLLSADDYVQSSLNSRIVAKNSVTYFVLCDYLYVFSVTFFELHL